jgi:ABC-type lipoprotein export system ATPase subunit
MVNNALTSPSPIIEVHQLEKRFQVGAHQLYAVRDLNLTIARGQFVAIMGPSGSGKSTLLYLLGGLDQPSAGEIIINGQPLSMLDGEALANFRRETVGFIFQAFHLIPTMTALDNVALPGVFNGLPRDVREQRAYQLMHMLGLNAWIDHKPAQLSGGQQQRVAIARALFNDPPIIMADEPTGQLDSQTGQHVFQLLEYMAQELGKTVMVVTHDARIARRAHRVVGLKDGRVVDDRLKTLVEHHEPR